MSSLKPQLVLLPGMHGTADLFTPLLARIPAVYEPRIITYPPGTALTYAQLLDHLRREVPRGRPIAVVAESFSGPLAVRYAADPANGHVRALVLAGSFITAPAPRVLRHLARTALFRLPLPTAVAQFALGTRRAAPEARDAVRTIVRAADPRVFAARVREILSVDATADLARCSLPVLCLRGTRDRLVRRSSLRRTLAVCPHAAVRDVPAGHAMLATAPDESWAHIGAFLAAIR